MKNFVVERGSPAEFLARVHAEIANRDLGRIVQLEGDDSRLVVRFRWMGTTELHYSLAPEGDGFRASLSDERVSPLHTAFRQTFDERFDQILAKVGAKTV